MKLVLAEKPSVAQSIAKVLGAAKREDGYLEGNGYVVSWCVGHLVELAQPEVYDAKYSKWAYLRADNIEAFSKERNDEYVGRAEEYKAAKSALLEGLGLEHLFDHSHELTSERERNMDCCSIGLM